ncbi:MAG: Phosphoribosylanthranilate isomerase, partial [Phycisphaerales bacterium]|nr:Phosphoribosylanthranilate isomerase [Phycisphaerales bacterium]
MLGVTLLPASSSNPSAEPRRTRIKICGVRRPADAAHAAAAGASAVGFVRYAAAARAVSAEVGADIVAALPDQVSPVALLVDP